MKLQNYICNTGDMFIGKGERRYYFTNEQRRSLNITRCAIYVDYWIVFYNDKPLCLLQDNRANLENAYKVKIAIRDGIPSKDLEIIQDEMEYKRRVKYE